MHGMPLLPARRSLVLLMALTPFAGCTDDVSGDGPTDDDGGSTTGSSTTDPTVNPTTGPGTTTDPGTTVTDPSTTTDPGTTTEAGSSETTEGPACGDPEDCADLVTECADATCEGGRCVVSNMDAGTACGDASEAECNAADACDGEGTCLDNVAGEGAACSECDGLECACGAGACSACAAFAESNEFATERSLVGWELTGDWGLYGGAPSAYLGGGDKKFGGGGGGGGMLLPAIPFEGQVFGTDGNRSAPYPGGHAEDSYARTKAFVLPTTLSFRSWHLDEGGVSYDNKRVRVSIDGGDTWVTLHDCQPDGKIVPLDVDQSLCEEVNLRDADDWDEVSFEVPKDMVGAAGVVEFGYETGDSCCDFERGWFIDLTNFATECACGDDVACDAFGTECGGGTCAAGGACALDPVGAGVACGSGDATSCGSADTCDADGYCQGNNLVNLLSCEDCPAGEESCNGCLDGTCLDCESPTDSFLAGHDEWSSSTQAGGGWEIFSEMPGNEQGDPAIMPTDTAFLGNDGSTVGPQDETGETATGSITSPVDVMPDMLVFDSWHIDEGGAGKKGGVDVKSVEVSTDSGETWTALADCEQPLLAGFPFCTRVETRGADEWDTIMLDTSAFAGMEAQVRFSYDTDDDCCGFEYGWYIDNLNFAQLCPEENPAGPDDDGGGKKK